MYKYILTVLLLVFMQPAFGQQVNNEKRIAELPQLIERAAAENNFEEAGKLQKELRIREDMQEAVLQKNYERAAELQRQLDGKTVNDETIRAGSETPSPVVVSASLRPPTFDPRKKFMLYVDFSPIGISLFGYTDYMYDWQTGFSYPVSVTESRYALNFKIGNRFYFGRAEGRKLRVGIDVNYLSLNIAPSIGSLPNLTFSLVRPGVVLNSFITEDLGIDFQFNAGLMTSFSDYIGFSMAGVSFNPQVKFWYKKISAGIEYNLGFLPSDELRFQYIGLSIGIRK